MDTHTLTTLRNVAIVTFTFLVAIAGMAYFWPTQDTEAAMISHNEYVDAVATTTRTTLSTNVGVASSTLTLRLADAQSFDFNLCALASTSAGTMRYKVFYSQGDPETLAASSTLTWFQETNVQASTTLAQSGTVMLAHAPVEHYLALSTTDTCFNLNQNPASAKWVQIRMSAQGATSTVWRSVVPKSEI